MEKDSIVNSCNGHSDSERGDGLVDEAASQGVQVQILAELKCMSARLEMVEGQVGHKESVNSKDKAKSQKISSSVKSKKFVKQSDSSSSESSKSLESSDDEIKVPQLSYIQSSKEVQKQIGRSIAKLETS